MISFLPAHLAPEYDKADAWDKQYCLFKVCPLLERPPILSLSIYKSVEMPPYRSSPLKSNTQIRYPSHSSALKASPVQRVSTRPASKIPFRRNQDTNDFLTRLQGPPGSTPVPKLCTQPTEPVNQVFIVVPRDSVNSRML